MKFQVKVLFLIDKVVRKILKAKEPLASPNKFPPKKAHLGTKNPKTKISTTIMTNMSIRVIIRDTNKKESMPVHNMMLQKCIRIRRHKLFVKLASRLNLCRS